MQASDQTWFCNLDGTCELAEGPVAVLYYSDLVLGMNQELVKIAFYV